MRPAAQLRGALREVDRRLPRELRRMAREAVRRGGAGTPLVSAVVVATEQDASWLGECLDSLRGQTHRRLEILVALPAGAGRAAAVARTHAREDWRVRALGHDGTPDAAANAAAGSARGRYLCFVGPCDLVPAAGVQALVESLERTGSDLAVGRSVQLPAPRSVESVPDPVHTGYLPATTIEDFPLAVADTGVGNRLFRTSYWRGAGLAVPERDEPGTRPLALDAFVSAGRFDVLPETTYHRMRRAGGVAFGTLADTFAGLDQWLVEQRAVWSTLEDAETTAVRDAWAYVVCDAAAVPFLDDVERATPEQFEALREFLAWVTTRMSERTWDRVRAECKAKVRLAVDGRRTRLEELVTSRWFEAGNRPTEVVGGTVYAALPFFRDPDAGLPDSCFAMTPEETSLQAVLRSARWRGGDLELGVFCYLDFVDQAGEPPELCAEVVGEEGARTPATVRLSEDPEVNVVAGHRYQDHSGGAATIVVDVPALVAAAPSGRWWLELTMRVRGVERRGTLARRDRSMIGRLGSPLVTGHTVAGRRIAVEADSRRGLTVSAHPPPEVVLAGAEVDGRRVTGTLHSPLPRLRSVAARAGGKQVRAPLTPVPDGYRFELRIPRSPDEETRLWRLLAVDAARREHEVGVPAGGADRWLGTGPGSEVVARRTGSGGVELVDSDRVVVLEDLALADGCLRVSGHWPGAVPADWAVALRSKRALVFATERSTDGQRFEASVPLRWDEWGLGAAPLPSGTYHLEVHRRRGGGSNPVRVSLAQSAADRLQQVMPTDELRVVPVFSGRQPAVRIGAPASADERGQLAQKRLQTWHREADLAVDPTAVYLQSYTGAAATDSQRAIHDELRRTRPDLTLYWAVADRSTVVPEGGVPVVMRSREWYRVLSTAGYLCNNIDFERWFRKRPGQQMLQTFHGYPAKSMGIRLWESKRFTPRRIEAELARTSAGWDLILTPTPEMDVHYRKEYRYDGPIESSGYPRDDVLVSEAAPGIRERTRALLGISREQTAVLYAPTWRDDLATSYRSAPIVRHLDLETASEKLGPEYVFLMRGHRFHAKGAHRAGRTARLIDVTDYPEVNDLILAADAAVLDYSSLRFDFALTGKPMLFLVPDLSSYVRGFLFPFEDSAPGPLIEDAREVVERLRDLDAVRAEFAAPYAAFDERFNYTQDGGSAARVVARFFR